MKGQPERLAYSDNGAVAVVDRAKGIALVNFSEAKQKVRIPVSLPEGLYSDAVSGTSFKVSKGRVEGTLAPLTTYILYSK